MNTFQLGTCHKTRPKANGQSYLPLKERIQRLLRIMLMMTAANAMPIPIGSMYMLGSPGSSVVDPVLVSEVVVDVSVVVVVTVGVVVIVVLVLGSRTSTLM